MTTEIFDYIIVGGGLAGSVISNRLFQSNDSLNILLVEAGGDVSNNSVIPYANNGGLFVGSDLDWGYSTVPQSEMEGRRISNPAGKCLGGGTAINACAWMRGDRSDYDQWAEIVGDKRYSYEGMLPYFIRTEEYPNPIVSPEQHGTGGPLYVASVSSTGRHYPLRDKLAQAWDENGATELPNLDGNSGHTLGRAELMEDRRQGLRQLASTAYPLGGAHVLTQTLVKRVLLGPHDGNVRATGIETVDGTQYHAKEVIVCAGAYRSPQLLMLSGIGPKDVLSSLGITPMIDSPNVGQNLHDHLQLSLYWKLKDPPQGLAVGSSNGLFSQHEFALGLPVDWIVTTTVPKDGLVEAIAADEGCRPDPNHPLLRNPRSFMEHIVVYAAGSASDPCIPVDGTHISSMIVGPMPTSKGHVTINSTNPADAPVIDPRYLSTKVDRYAFQTGLRTVANLMLRTEAGRSFIDGETPPDGFEPISPDSSDEYLDARTRHGAFSTYHSIGTCSMGSVVDTDFRVVGVSNLRVVDASVIPTPIAAHIQAAVYAMAEQAADIIMGRA